MVAVAAAICLGTGGCGPSGPDFQPAGPLFDDGVVTLDPEAVVPFGAPPELMIPTVSRTDGTISLKVPGGSLATGWEAIAVVDGVARAASFETGASTMALPAGTEEAGVRPVHGALRGAVTWADGPGQGASGLAPSPGWTWTLDPAWAPQVARTVSARVDLVLLDAGGDDLRGSATLVLDPVVALDAITLRLEGTASAVRDAAGASLPFAPTPGGILVTFPATAVAGTPLTLSIDWAIPDLKQDRGGRTVSDATAELLYAGDSVAWFPRPADTPAGASDLRFVIDAPDTFTVFTGGEVTARVAVAAGRGVTTSELTWPLRAWPLLAAGVFVRESPVPELTVAALASGAPTLGPHAAELAQVLAFYQATFGPLPGPEVTLVEVPDAFQVGFAGPGLIFVPTVHWDRPPSTWSRFLLFHELSHQWWGHASFIADPRDAWLIEGLADYSATRALERVEGVGGAGGARAHAVADLALLHRLIAEGYGGQPGRDLPVRPDDPAQLQDYIFYLKGDWVLRYLESILGRTVFDAGWSAYAAATRFGDTTTVAFREAMETAAGASLAWYFDAWLLETGFPAVRYEPYFREVGGQPEVSLGLSQVGGMSGDAARPWTLPLRWQRADPMDTAAGTTQFAGCLREASALVSPDDSHCLP